MLPRVYVQPLLFVCVPLLHQLSSRLFALVCIYVVAIGMNWMVSRDCLTSPLLICVAGWIHRRAGGQPERSDSHSCRPAAERCCCQLQKQGTLVNCMGLYGCADMCTGLPPQASSSLNCGVHRCFCIQSSLCLFVPCNLQYGYTSLVAACENGHEATVTLLLSHGADLAANQVYCVPCCVKCKRDLFAHPIGTGGRLLQ